MPMLDFKGKQFVYAHHLSVPFRTLEIDAKQSLPPPGSKPDLDDNLIIHGDNLHALKALLPTYAGKVDCIYIDPPYNTGEEGWCYNDNVRSPLMKEWLKKSANPVDKDDLERHDKWLCMMWPRLKLLKDLLSDNGVLFVSIDDIEVGHARLILDEIFGHQNLLAQLIWKSRQNKDNRNVTGISNDHEYVLCYGSPLRGAERDATQYSNPDNDPRGPWTSGNMVGLATEEARPNLHYDLTDPASGITYKKPRMGWRYDAKRMSRMIEERRILWPPKPSGRPREKAFLSELQVEFTGYSSMVGAELYTRDGSIEVANIFGEKRFDFPKPSALIQELIEQATDGESIILDSFAGSGTTAHAVLKQNRKDGGNRRFILVECEDYADKLTAERVRRVINGYSFEGTHREELYRRKLNFTVLKKAGEILGSIEGVENLEKHRFDKISKTVKNDELVVTGEKKVTEKTEGLGGSFTYCTLGEEINLQTLLSGEKLPAYDALAKYVFYTATGQTLPNVPKPGKVWFIGETTLYRVHLLYKPEKKWLRSNASALTQEMVDAIAKQADPTKKTLVFASTKFMGQKDLTRQHIEFCQLPYAIYRVLGD